MFLNILLLLNNYFTITKKQLITYIQAVVINFIYPT